jgi:hypothetical protein
MPFGVDPSGLKALPFQVINHPFGQPDQGIFQNSEAGVPLNN